VIQRNAELSAGAYEIGKRNDRKGKRLGRWADVQVCKYANVQMQGVNS